MFRTFPLHNSFIFTVLPIFHFPLAPQRQQCVWQSSVWGGRRSADTLHDGLQYTAITSPFALCPQLNALKACCSQYTFVLKT